MKQSVSSDSLHKILARLQSANGDFNAKFPGPPVGRQAVHTVYGGAHLFKADLMQRMSEIARRALATYASDGPTLARAVGEAPNDALWSRVYERTLAKLEREAVEDFRIDFEDGYGIRPDEEEDGHAESTAEEVARGLKQESLPPFLGIRIKPFNDENKVRSARTLDIFLSTLLSHTGGRIPEGFVVTLPKVTLAEQPAALADLLTLIEKAHRLDTGTLKFELMAETPQAILGADGRVPLRDFVDAGQGRCVAVHFGTYDYTAGCQITAAYQTMNNPVCDFAKHVMQVSLAGLPLFLSDGATNVMPIGPHRETLDRPLTQAQLAENEAIVHNAWRVAYRNIRHSLETGYFQGWDLHPAQLPVRYAAVYAFFLATLEPASARLKAFVEKAAKATLMGDIFDDAATGQGLLNFFLRAVACGAITQVEAEKTGLTAQDFQGRSFLRILERRKAMG